MTSINLKNLGITLINESEAIRVITELSNIILPNQSLENVENIIRSNHEIVYDYYFNQIKGSEINDDELNQLSLLIVLHYLYMYNLWKNKHIAKSYQNLTFKYKDFENPSTYDWVFSFFKKTSLSNWKIKSAKFLGLTSEELEVLYRRRSDFYNK